MAGLKVLIADDHAIVRAGFRRVIEQMPDLEIFAEVGDGNEITAILDSNPIDLLLIDVTMPNFQPIIAIKEIRKQFPKMKILVVSAYDDDVYVKGLLQAGVNGYHLKDEPLENLKLAIGRVLEGERWISASLISKLVQSPPTESALPDLSERLQHILRLLQQGFDNKKIAREMSLSIKTIENHLTRLYRKLDVHSRLESVNYVNRFPQILGVTALRAAADNSISLDVLSREVSILVLDDNSRYRKQMLHMIGKASSRATIYEAGSIAEASQLVERVGFQLAFVDVILKDEDGIAGSRRLHIIKPDMRIILISAYADREFHRQGMESGAFAFLDKKNLDLPTLKQIIQDLAN